MQVLLNLLSNAIKFCDSKAGRVRVCLQVETGALQVDIIDNGPGVRAEDHDLIFEKFRQVGNTLTEKPQGTGLGLPICRSIISHFGGKLWVENEPGLGAKFSFTLPLEPHPQEREPSRIDSRLRILTTIKSLRGFTLSK